MITKSGLTVYIYYVIIFFFQFTTKVKSCSPAEISILNQKNKKEKVKGFEIILEDTILFPEGGGQVCVEFLIREVKHCMINVLSAGDSDIRVRVRVMVFNATSNNISVISWRPVLLVEETGLPRENH